MEPKFLPLKYGLKDFEVLALRHSAAKYVYFRSKGCKPPKEVAFNRPVGPYQDVEGSAGAGYAGADDDRIRKLMNGDHHWIQIGGTDSPDPALHTYEQRKGPSASWIPTCSPAAVPAMVSGA
eukprot:TRINITY_DN67542_c0_g1_i1.p1 TRINITY_DN67542_c0_g1~~TRINITY_DN67542_c0_g1_i1.p1  ORF type:complete len:131 (-),score=28.16 TRINITY_DN67542_c0_g1_i1:128-493(-)